MRTDREECCITALEWKSEGGRRPGQPKQHEMKGAQLGGSHRLVLSGLWWQIKVGWRVCQSIMLLTVWKIGVYTHDIMAIILVYQNNETVAILV